MVRVYFFWSQVEPEPGRFSFDAVDAFLEPEGVAVAAAILDELLARRTVPGRVTGLDISSIL